MQGMMLEAANVVHFATTFADCRLLGTSAFLLVMYISVHFTV